MKYVDFKTEFFHLGFFCLQDVLVVEPDFDRRRFSEWQAKNYIQKILRGFYKFSDYQIDDLDRFVLANQLFKPSYVSLESALRYYNFIPESTYSITSVSSRNTKNYETLLGHFRYRKMLAKHFNGYQLIKHKNREFKIAKPEKAILDFLYLRADLNDIESIESLRLDIAEMQEQIDLEIFNQAVINFQSPVLAKRANMLQGLLSDA